MTLKKLNEKQSQRNDEFTVLSEVLSHEGAFRQILDAISDMVLVKGPNSRLLWANKAFCNCYGMTTEQLRGLIDAPFSEPDHTVQYVKDDALVFTSGKVLDILQEPVNRHDGVVNTFHTVKSPIFDKEGKVVMTVGISRDVTDRIAQEKALEEGRASAAYSAKMATLGEMAGGVAHELNTPLAVIHTLAQQLQEIISDAELDRGLLRDKAGQIEKTATRIAKIVSGLRTFSRDGSRDPLAETNVAQLIEETLAFSRERFANHGINLSAIHQDMSLTVECSPTQISQVIINLLNNAHDAVDQLAQKWVRLETRFQNGFVEIVVTDSGNGISETILGKIFAPFFSTKKLGMGTGLGLSISRGLVEMHHGELTIDTSNRHTSFLVRLPKQQVLKMKTAG